MTAMWVDHAKVSAIIAGFNHLGRTAPGENRLEDYAWVVGDICEGMDAGDVAAVMITVAAAAQAGSERLMLAGRGIPEFERALDEINGRPSREPEPALPGVTVLHEFRRPGRSRRPTP